ncbi:hypothetical protein [Candidatus Pseudothioglobus sp. Uisw_050_01]|uniref:hypothetical protein n=1 Tax=Candidatus Pseudothioglobus sp. Uisw_050_01 TaxID=3230997 RepID=UPI003A8C2447
MKQLLLTLVLSFSLTGITYAEGLSWSNFFFPKLEKFNNCVEALEKENIDNSHKLCADKYAKEIDSKYAKTSDEIATYLGEVVMDIENTSSKFIIKKTTMSGYFKCKDTSKCEKQYFNITRYPSITPGQKSSVHFWKPEKIQFLESLNAGEWSWNITSKSYYGFKFDY